MRNDATFIGYSTKYALSFGILRCEFSDCTDNMVMVVRPFKDYLIGEGREWHRTFESAVKRAEEMRTAKLKSLNKSIEKVSGLDFSKEPEMK